MKFSRSLLNFSSPAGPANDSLKPKAAIRTSGFSSLSVWPWSLKCAWRGRKRQLVGRIAQVVDHQLQLGEPAVEQGLEVAVILHPLGQRVADQDDPVALVRAPAPISRPIRPARRPAGSGPGSPARTAARSRIVISLVSSSLFCLSNRVGRQRGRGPLRAGSEAAPHPGTNLTLGLGHDDQVTFLAGLVSGRNTVLPLLILCTAAGAGCQRGRPGSRTPAMAMAASDHGGRARVRPVG